MVRQAQINQGANGRAATQDGLGHGFSELLGDAATLAKLQLRLLQADLQQAIRNIVLPTVVAVFAAVVATCTIPVALIGLGYLVSNTGLPLSWALLLVAGAVAVFGILAVLLAARKLRRSFVVFQRSQAEFVKNVQWCQQAVKRARHPPSTRPTENHDSR
mgnify:CR=1 FL=1